MTQMPARVLPANAALMLQRAARTPDTEQNPRARLKAVEKAIERIKTLYPHYFIQEQMQ